MDGKRTSDHLTLLKCTAIGALATKKIVVNSDGSIEKQSYSAGKDFTVRRISVSDIWTLGQAIKDQELIKNEVLIRGEPVDGHAAVVPRRTIGREGGAFKEVARHWIMLDIDDFKLPEWLNPAIDPEGVVKWVRASLPEPFRKATCYYQFSSGQNLSKHIGEEPPRIAKLHLFFWLSVAHTSEQLRDYINGKA